MIWWLVKNINIYHLLTYERHTISIMNEELQVKK